MSLSRMVCMADKTPVYLVCLRALRTTSSLSAAKSDKSAMLEESDEPGFFKRVYCRFKGIPLKGEVHPPRALLEDIDKEFFAPEPLPEMSRDYKEYPERDLKHFPYPTRRMYPPKSRMLVFPDSWFSPFYKITGVSGPYMFFGGLFLFLVNKEIFVFDEPAAILINWILIYLLASRAFGYRIDKYTYGKLQKKMDRFKGLIEDDLKNAKEFRKISKAEKASLMAVKENFPIALKESMEMQLEAAYRANIEKTAMEIKSRIEYLEETEEAEKRFRRDHMLNWIINSVRAEIDQNKDGIKDQILNDCIQDLNELAARTH